MSIEKLATEIRKEQIAQAALALVATQGLKGLNMAKVAKRIGLVPSALYRHFKNKDEICYRRFNSHPLSPIYDSPLYSFLFQGGRKNLFFCSS